MRKLIKASILGIIAFCIYPIHAQIPGFILGDENFTLTLAFHKVDTLLVVVPHNYKITGESHVNDITKMRQTYFKSVSTRHFDFELAKTLYTDSLRAVILEQADKYLQNLCTTLKTDTLDMGRMTTYVYQNMPELQQFLSMSPRMTILGKSFGSVNHVSTFDMTIFNHETSHTLIARKVGIQSNNFFCEGFAVYTGYFMGDSHYTSDLDSTTIHLDLLTEEAIFGDNHLFYSLPPMYPISGTFTCFIIDKIGIDAFKDIYAQQNLEDAF